MHDDARDFAPDAQLVETAESWGWRNPPQSVLAIAEQARRAKHTPSAQLLVEMGVISEEQKSRWLVSKPEGADALAWFSEQDSSVTPFVERVQALKAGHPYYEGLSDLSIHPCMQEPAVAARADELDATVMLIEETLPVLVFSTFGSLMKFRSMGRAARQADAIVRAVGADLQIAAGPRDEISAVLTAARLADDAMGSGEAANVWSAGAAENQGTPEGREVTRLMDHALKQGATDVALMPLRNGEILVQMRKHGEMIAPRAVSPRMAAELGRQVIALLQSKSGANPSNTILRVPADGQITYRSGSGDAFLRASFIPQNHLGEVRNLTSASIRLLPRAERSISLAELQLDPRVTEQIRFAMRMSQGLVLAVGPTNSGKSTTIAGAIGEHVDLFGDSRKRVSVEDPIERYLHGVQQYNAPVHIKDETLRFELILKAFKRHDPDLIWVGEVRDKVTADMCVASASTGHLVLSTLHANDAVMAFDVLAKTVDAEKRFQLIESMSLVVSQRLVKQLCPKCRIVAAPSPEQLELFARYTQRLGETAQLPERIANADQNGCDHELCDHGYIGLLPLNEVLPFDRKAKDAAIRMVSGQNSRQELAGLRTLTLLESGLDLLRAQHVDLDAVLV